MNDDDAAAKKAQTLIFRLKSSLIKSDVASRTLLNILFDTKPASKADFYQTDGNYLLQDYLTSIPFACKSMAVRRADKRTACSMGKAHRQRFGFHFVELIRHPTLNWQDMAWLQHCDQRITRHTATAQVALSHIPQYFFIVSPSPPSDQTWSGLMRLFQSVPQLQRPVVICTRPYLTANTYVSSYG